MDAIGLVEASQLKKNRGDFAPGDAVKVQVKVVEGEKERIQAFEGVVIRKRGEGARASFTVRRISYGVGVERTFPLHSPMIERVQVVRRGDVRRSKLYYLRALLAARPGPQGRPLPLRTGGLALGAGAGGGSGRGRAGPAGGAGRRRRCDPRSESPRQG